MVVLSERFWSCGWMLLLWFGDRDEDFEERAKVGDATSTSTSNSKSNYFLDHRHAYNSEAAMGVVGVNMRNTS